MKSYSTLLKHLTRLSRRPLARKLTTDIGQLCPPIGLNVSGEKLLVDGLHVNTQPVGSRIQTSILSRYKTVGVQNSWVTTSPDNLFLWSRLGISAPWYCDNTGHMNAVELNLIFNQMMYLAIYESICRSRIPQWNDFLLARYMDKAWSDFLIVNICSSFRQPIVVDQFSGVLRMGQPTVSKSGRHLLFNLKLKVHQDITHFPSLESEKEGAVSVMTLAVKDFKEYPK
jgi:hypothetical protein